MSPHAIRRGSITHYLTKDVPTEVVSDRMNVSRDVLDQHYDKRFEEVKLEQRQGYLETSDRSGEIVFECGTVVIMSSGTPLMFTVSEKDLELIEQWNEQHLEILRDANDYQPE